MDKLVELEQEQIQNNQENRKLTKRNSKRIKKFFHGVYEKYIDQSVRIKDVKLKFKQFRNYVKVVSNYEIELVDGGDSSELKLYLKTLWKKLAEEHKLF
mmetsp:Transcript_1509/g.2670  ORF Transcript_1509/g.2670 Transcript_1509/m.2670 type:complete len:99 (-) Transcript_1509:134-430(-)